MKSDISVDNDNIQVKRDFVSPLIRKLPKIYHSRCHPYLRKKYTPKKNLFLLGMLYKKGFIIPKPENIHDFLGLLIHEIGNTGH